MPNSLFPCHMPKQHSQAINRAIKAAGVNPQGLPEIVKSWLERGNQRAESVKMAQNPHLSPYRGEKP